MEDLKRYAILADTREKKDKHPEQKILMANGYEVIPQVLPVGDYAVATPRFQAVKSNHEHESFVQAKFKNGEMTDYKIRAIDLMGTYSLAVDVKQDLNELQSNLLNSSKGKRYRFERELMRASFAGIKLYVVIADDSVMSQDDIMTATEFNNSAHIIGLQLVERMNLLNKAYGTIFRFCSKKRLPEVILELLSKEKYIENKKND